MGRPLECTRNEVLAAVKAGRGKTTLVARILQVSTETVRNYARRWQSVAEALEAERLNFDTALVDKAEVQLENAVARGQPWAIKYALATKGKDRGYVERYQQELTGKDGAPVEVNTVELTDDERASRIAAILDAARTRRDRPAGDE